MRYEIYRLCRDKERIEKLKREEKQYSLPQTKYLTGIDMFVFINSVIQKCPYDYALLCHDDVILPININANITECITSANHYMGEENWAVIGNAGIQILTKKVLHYLTDPNINILPPSTYNPQIVESIDGNVMLLNIKNLRKNNILLPKNLTGFHLYDLILCLESQKKGLLCAVSSYLFATHLSGGNREAFINAWKMPISQKYFSDNFTNQTISSINGEVIIKNSTRNGIDINEKMIENVQKTFHKNSFELNIISKKRNKSAITFKKHTDKNIKVNIYSEDSIINLLKRTSSTPNSFVIILQQDDVIYSEISKYLLFMMSSSDIIIGDSKIIEGDNKESIEHSANIENIYTGKRKTPINLVIYQSELLQKTLNNIKITDNTFINDYSILIEALKYGSYETYPILFGERHYKKVNKDIDDYVHTTMLSQIANNNIVRQDFYNLYRKSTEQLQTKLFEILPDYTEFSSFRSGPIWKALSNYRKIKNSLRIKK